MENLLYHPTTKHQLTALISSKPHAVVISGESGVGKKTVAKVLISGILDHISSPYVLEITPGGGASIGIEQIRTIRDFVSRKTTGLSEIRRIIVIQKAHTMTNEAQNTLLKNLEEPPTDTAIILITDDIMALRPTIRSRAQQLLVLPVSQNVAHQYFMSHGYDESKINSAYFMSDGRVGLMAALLEQSDDHELVRAINEAKQILKADNYSRLIMVDGLAKDKNQAQYVLKGLARVVGGGLGQAAAKNNKVAVKKFYKLSNLVQDAQDAWQANVNPKLVLTKLFLQM